MVIFGFAKIRPIFGLERSSHFGFMLDVLILLVRRGIPAWRYALLHMLRPVLALYKAPCSAPPMEALAELVVYWCHSLDSARIARAAELLLPFVNAQLPDGSVPLALFNLLRPAPDPVYPLDADSTDPILGGDPNSRRLGR